MSCRTNLLPEEKFYDLSRLHTHTKPLTHTSYLLICIPQAEQRATASDFMEMEQERGISISSTVMNFEYDGFGIRLMDTPGHQDFSEDTYRALAAADNAVGGAGATLLCFFFRCIATAHLLYRLVLFFFTAHALGRCQGFGTANTQTV